MILALLQASAGSDFVRTTVQYIGNAAAIGAFGFCWHTSHRLTRLEAALSDAGGVNATIEPIRRGLLTEHETRLDNHDTEIARLDRDKEPRRTVQPADVGTFDRRHTR